MGGDGAAARASPERPVRRPRPLACLPVERLGWKSRHKLPAPGEAKEPLIPGMSDDQLFFVAFSQVWCSLSTPEFLRNQVTTDSHSPGQVRAILPLVNLPEFAQTFSCPAGSKMHPKERCTVW